MNIQVGRVPRLHWLGILLGMILAAAQGQAQTAVRPITTRRQGQSLVGTVHLLPGQSHLYRAFASVKPKDLGDCASETITVKIEAWRQRPVRGMPGVLFHVRVTVKPETPLGTYYAPVAISHYKHQGREVTEISELRIIVVDKLPGTHRTLARFIRGAFGVAMILVLVIVFFGMIAYLILRVFLGVSKTGADAVEKDEDEEEDIDEELVKEALSATTEDRPPDEQV